MTFAIRANHGHTLQDLVSHADWIGFDMDHALVRYHLPTIAELLYRGKSEYMIRKLGWPASLREAPDIGFFTRGVIMDFSTGNVIKISHSGQVLRAYHGTRRLTDEDLTADYGPEHQWPHIAILRAQRRHPHFAVLFTYFEVAGPALLARMTDLVDSGAHTPAGGAHRAATVDAALEALADSGHVCPTDGPCRTCDRLRLYVTMCGDLFDAFESEMLPSQFAASAIYDEADIAAAVASKAAASDAAAATAETPAVPATSAAATPTNPPTPFDKIVALTSVSARARRAHQRATGTKNECKKGANSSCNCWKGAGSRVGGADSVASVLFTAMRACPRLFVIARPMLAEWLAARRGGWGSAQLASTAFPTRGRTEGGGMAGVVLITNSHCDFTDLIMSTVLGSAADAVCAAVAAPKSPAPGVPSAAAPATPEVSVSAVEGRIVDTNSAEGTVPRGWWRSLFDVVICAAAKPAFFEAFGPQTAPAAAAGADASVGAAGGGNVPADAARGDTAKQPQQKVRPAFKRPHVPGDATVPLDADAALRLPLYAVGGCSEALVAALSAAKASGWAPGGVGMRGGTEPSPHAAASPAEVDTAQVGDWFSAVAPTPLSAPAHTARHAQVASFLDSLHLPLATTGPSALDGAKSPLWAPPLTGWEGGGAVAAAAARSRDSVSHWGAALCEGDHSRGAIGGCDVHVLYVGDSVHGDVVASARAGWVTVAVAEEVASLHHATLSDAPIAVGDGACVGAVVTASTEAVTAYDRVRDASALALPVDPFPVNKWGSLLKEGDQPTYFGALYASVPSIVVNDAAALWRSV